MIENLVEKSILFVCHVYKRISVIVNVCLSFNFFSCVVIRFGIHSLLTKMMAKKLIKVEKTM